MRYVKQLFFILILVIVNLQSFAQIDSTEYIVIIKNQKEIDANFNWSLIGVNSSLNYIYSHKKNAITAGIKIHHNRIIFDNQSYAYKNRGYAQNFGESVGLNLGYRNYFLSDCNSYTPYFFFQTQLSYLRFRNVFEHSIIRDELPVIIKNTRISNPHIITENIFGLGFAVKIYKKCYFTQSAGFGISTFLDNAYFKNNKLPNRSFTWSFSSLVRVGITYKIN